MNNYYANCRLTSGQLAGLCSKDRIYADKHAGSDSLSFIRYNSESSVFNRTIRIGNMPYNMDYRVLTNSVVQLIQG